MKKSQCAAPYAEEFVDFILQHYHCYWLSPECCQAEHETRLYLSEFFNETIINKLMQIEPTVWNSSKTQALDFSADFVWIDSFVFDYEKEKLRQNGREHQLLLLNPVNPDLRMAMIQLNEMKSRAYLPVEEVKQEEPETPAEQEVAEEESIEETQKPSFFERLLNILHEIKERIPKFSLNKLPKITLHKPDFSNLKSAPKIEINHKLLVSVFAVIVGIIALVFVVKYVRNKAEVDNYVPIEKIIDWTEYKNVFTDLQPIQEATARAHGLSPIENRADVEKICSKRVEQGKMVKLESNEYYEIYNLTHSHPYVIPSVATFLDELGKRIQTKANGSDSRFRITSLTRTVEDVRLLQGVNNIATKNSCHLFGTTVDIQFTDGSFFHGKHPTSDHNMRILLFQTLKEMRDEGWCYVKYEAPNGCCHITVRK